LATNGKELWFGHWNSNSPTRLVVAELQEGLAALGQLKAQIGWENVQEHALKVARKLYPQDFFLPYEALGQNRVRLTKIGTNSFAEELAPLLYRYFQSEDQAIEDEIIEFAYVSSDTERLLNALQIIL
jgi:hypothetical protein